MDLSQKPNRNENPQEHSKIVWVLLSIVLAAWSYFSYHNWITDSEFWPITVSREILNLGTTSHPAIFYKPVFHLSLFWLHLLPLDNVQHIHAAKALYTLVGVGIFICSFLLARRFLDPGRAIAFFLMLISSATIFSHMGAIRSGILVTFFVLLGLIFVERVSKQSKPRQLFFWFFWILLIFCTTPKAAFICIFLLISFWFIADRAFYRSLIKFLALTFIIATGALLLFGRGTDGRLWNSFVSALAHGLTGQKESSIGFGNSWIKLYLSHDFLFIFTGFSLWLISCYSWFKKKNSLEPMQKFMSVFAGLISLLFLFFEPKQLFFIAGLFPLWAVCWAPALEHYRTRVSVIIAGILLLGCCFRGNVNVYHYSNARQVSAARDLNVYALRNPDATLVDGIGILPRYSKYLIYLGPDDEVNQASVIEFFNLKKPEFVLMTPRVLKISHALADRLVEDYEVCERGLSGRKGLCSSEKQNWQWLPMSTFGYKGFRSKKP